MGKVSQISSYTLSLVFLFACTSIIGQITFQKTYGSLYGNHANSVELTDDGGFLVSGWYDMTSLFTSEFYLIKTDELGDTLWARTYGTRIDSTAKHNGGNLGYHAIPALDGGYLMVGEVHGFGAGAADVYIIKVDSLGSLEWSRTYGTTEADYSESVLATSDGSYLICGYTESVGQRDAYLLKIDVDGELIWSRTIGGSSIDAASQVIESPRGGYIMIGYAFSFGSSNSDVYLVKLDEDGTVSWSKTYDGHSVNRIDWAPDSTVGYSNIVDNLNYHLYPNPSEGVVNLYNGEAQAADYSIYSSLGQLLNTGTVQPGQSRLELNLPSGWYVFQIKDRATGVRTNESLIVR